MSRDNVLEGVIDLHIHTAPDVRERRMDDLDIMEAAVARKVRAAVFKSHHITSVQRAIIANKVKSEKYPDSDFQAFGGIVLNRFMGGLNPYALETALKLGGKMVWLPTLTSENHIERQGKKSSVPPVKVTENGKIVPELRDIFELIKDFDAVLETGHISDKECFIVAEAARNAGVKKIVITHPEFWIVGMSLEAQQKIVKDYDVLLEHVYAQPIGGGAYKKNLADNVEAMKTIGCEHFIVATDSGQTQNPFWYESLTEYINYLYDVGGFTEEQVNTMTKINPGKMLGID